MINLLPVSTTLPIKENPWQSLIVGVNDTADKFNSGVNWQFIAGVVDTAGKHSFAIISTNFEKSRNDPNGIVRGQGDSDSWKKIEVENLVSDSL